MSTDQGLMNYIPEQQQARFDELLSLPENTWRDNPKAPEQLLEIASMVLHGVPVLTDRAYRQSALENYQAQRNDNVVTTRLIGGNNNHTDFSVAYGTDRFRMISLARQSETQTITLALAFKGHEFLGATMNIKDPGNEKTGEIREFGITPQGILREVFKGAPEPQGRPVNLDSLTQALVNRNTFQTPLNTPKLLTDIAVPK